MKIYLLSHTSHILRSISSGYICLVATELDSADRELFPLLQNNLFSRTRLFYFQKTTYGDFLGGAVVKNPPDNAGDVGSSPGPGRSHMPWGN